MEKKSFEQLREQYPVFYYHGYTLENDGEYINIEYNFEIEGLSEFHPTNRIRLDNLTLANAFDTKTAKSIVFNLGMVELVSYWKCACPKKVVVECGHLHERDINWWKKLYFNGLSEFF